MNYCRSLFFGCILNVFCAISFASTIDLSVAKGVKLIEASHYQDQYLALVSFNHPLSNVFINTNIGAWNNPDTLLATAGAGVQFGNLSLGLSAGAISKTNASLGTHFQFLIAIKYIILQRFLVGIYHISNGNDLFHNGYPNAGEDFIGVGVSF